MNPLRFRWWMPTLAVWWAAAPPAPAAGQSGGPYRVGADVVVFSSPPAAIGSASYQIVPVVAQYGAVGAQAGGGYGIIVGFLSSPPATDTDQDGTPDDADADVDDDGVPNEMDARPYDTDNDGLNNFEDGDDDIDLSGLSSVNSFREAIARASQTGNNVTFSFDEGTLILQNTRLSNLDSDDFIF